MTEEDFKNQLLSLFEEIEPEFARYEKVISEMGDNALMEFEKEEIAIKNRLVHDVSVSDDELASRYLAELQSAHDRILEETKRKISEYVQSLQPAL